MESCSLCAGMMIEKFNGSSLRFKVKLICNVLEFGT
jgi:hypothetical protein